MTKEEQIKKITESCIEANPEIVELKFGCVIRLDSGSVVKYIRHSDNSDNSNNIWIEGDKNKEPVCLSGWSVGFEIIGRPVQLADVLMAIPRDKRIGVASDGTFVSLTNGDTGIQWNLTKPLSEQSEETINSIAELL